MVSETFDAKRWREVEGFAFEDITYHRAVDQGTVRIAFDRPEVRNAVDGETAAALAGLQRLAALALTVPVVWLLGVPLAEAVVQSTTMAPLLRELNAPSFPVVTCRRSSSLPTQMKTNSASFAASAGVAAVSPPYCSAHIFALSAVRL